MENNAKNTVVRRISIQISAYFDGKIIAKEMCRCIDKVVRM